MIFSNFFLYHVIPHPLKLLSANARNFIFILADLVDVTLLTDLDILRYVQKSALILVKRMRKDLKIIRKS